ncbi:unnamed protein product, partial [Polarella glacialis]
HNSAPRDHVSLRVSPTRGLGALRYECSVDGSVVQVGSGESLFHFPRVERYGQIKLAIRAPGQTAATAGGEAATSAVAEAPSPAQWRESPGVGGRGDLLAAIRAAQSS